MTEFLMFAGTLVFFAIALPFLRLLMPAAERATLRAGLWVNGIEGRAADEIIEHEMNK